MAKIDILMATYNGAKYIKTQIMSIISQSFTDWRLVIHDDGSTDKTILIIKSLMTLDNRIQLIEDGVKCGGAAQNFMHLAKYSNAKYTMYADQDDIWFDNKIKILYNLIQRKDNTIPQVYYSNSNVWIPDIGIDGKSTMIFAKKLKDFLFLNSGVQGCVSIFNRLMCDELIKWDGPLAMHDHILQLLSITIGRIGHTNLSLMLYRNHNENVTGNTATSTTDIKQIISNANVPVVDNKHFEVIVFFLDKYRYKLNQSDISILENYIQMKDCSVIKKIKMVIVNRFTVFNSSLRLIIKVLIRPYITQ